MRRAEQLLDAAEELVALCGVEAVGMNAVARHAGVSPGTLYQYFPHKRALVDGLSQRFAERLAEAGPTLDGVLRSVLVLAESRPALLPLLCGTGPAGEPNALFECLATRLSLAPDEGELATRFLVQGVAAALRRDDPVARDAVLARTRAAILGACPVAGRGDTS
ncbi:TetR/AcrR family transcriptional regulator [Streptomyces sp. cg40]|uniref:TetR/AcrR family transcriptional regulator n=1 Tax=Streptomyces sp. cg40 TaxID=3419764 RepID=UPI003D0510C7